MRRSQRIGWIEWARALGACAVVMLHVFVSTALAADVGVVRQSVYVVVGIVLGRWAVPAFFMVTGYLLLDPARDCGWDRARAHARRMALVLATYGLAFSLMEEAWAYLRVGHVPTPAVLALAVRDVLSASSWDHLWYVYALMFAYLLVPCIRRLRDRLGSARFGRVTMGLFVAVMVVPTLAGFVVVSGGGTFALPTGGIGALVPNVAIGVTCMCVGAALRRWRLGPRVVLCGVGSLVTMVAYTLWGVLVAGAEVGFVFLQGSCFACAYAVLVLLALRRVVGDKPMAPHTLADTMAHHSFGVYVLHPVFVHAVLLVCDPLACAPGAFEVVFLAGVIAASLAATALVRRVPVVGALL